MAQLLSYFTQVLLFTVGPLLLFGAVLYFARALFSFFVGEREGRRILLALYAPATPMRELAHALSELVHEGEYGMVLRAKGIVAGKEGEWLHFDYVPGEPDVRVGSAGIIGRLCVIGADLDREALSALFGAELK